MSDWKQEMTRIKREKGSVITNFTMTSVEEKVCEKVYKGESYYATLYKEIDKYVLNFAVASLNDLHNLIRMVPGNTVINIIYREDCDLHDFFLAEGLLLHMTYQRTTIRYKSNPYLYPEKNKKRQILPKMYDPDCGEYPGEEDAQELDALCRTVFDPLCDDMYSIDEWKEKIRNKEVLVYRDEGKITAYYLFRLEGKKLYSNMSVNIGAANTLYNMERRIFEEMWDKGIRIFYGWGNPNNPRAKRHANHMNSEVIRACAETVNRSYCDTYYKSR